MRFYNRQHRHYCGIAHKIDSQKIAALLRGGLLPQAYVYPAAMRSTRDLLRRRLRLVRKRGQLLAHIQNTRAQYQLPEFGKPSVMTVTLFTTCDRSRASARS